LSINYDHIPAEVKQSGKRTFRTLSMEGEEIEFSDGFTDLHTRSYQEIINGNGFGLEDALPSIKLVHQIRNAQK
jgi:UDP-N-acetyl-2-amino-2-deoxyglucuronate dehydrogenase